MGTHFGSMIIGSGLSSKTPGHLLIDVVFKAERMGDAWFSSATNVSLPIRGEGSTELNAILDGHSKLLHYLADLNRA
jgi:hypothetical protein